jgi:hypothetical protein|tara:strand:+ start:756 stop:992 length:237 start_codon:yes stop_codon:yes gene_type:complete
MAFKAQRHCRTHQTKQVVSDLVASMHYTHQLSITVLKCFNHRQLNGLGMAWQHGLSNTIVVLIQDEPKGGLLHGCSLH